MEENLDINENNIEDVTTESMTNVYLPSGNALLPSEVYPITAAEKSKFVILLGAVGSGKTAICTSIYSCFLDGKFEVEYCFAGSKTLATFEEYSYLTRTTSEEPQPTHERTVKGTQNVLHIRTYIPLEERYMNFLIADFSGEDYENVIGNVDYAKDEFQILRAASVVALVLDGEKMCKATTRVAEIQQSITLLRTFYDANLISNNKSIIILVSKFDLVQKAGVANWHELIMDKFKQQLPNLESNFIIKEVAPLSEHNDVVSVGHGIKDFFKEIMERKVVHMKNYELPDTESQFEIWGRGAVSNDK